MTGIDGPINFRSIHSPSDTVDLLKTAIPSKGMTVMAEIDHAAAAKGSGLVLRPTTVLLFGNPKSGTPLMQETQTIGIDLPLKILVWQSEDGVTWLSYNDPFWLMRRHIVDGSAPNTAEAMGNALIAIARLASGSETSTKGD
jgi:uncharacterized protein (DUF302 family)